MFAEILHHSFDFFCTRLSFTHDRNTLFLRKSVFDIYVLQQFIHRLTVIFRPCRYLGHHGTRRHGIFITNEIFYQEAVTFFSATDILTFTLKFPHYGSNPFKSGVHIEALYSVTVGDFLHQFCGYDRLYHICSFTNAASRLILRNKVMSKEQSILVSIH